MSKIFLRALETNDFRYTQKWHSDQDLFMSLGGPFRFISADAEKEWLVTKSHYSNQEINLMICLPEGSTPIGMVSVREIDWIGRKGLLTGIIIGEKQHHQYGYATEALRLLLKHCFMDLGLNRIWTQILVDNQHSISLFTKCGFQAEGQLRQHVFKEGNYKDVLLFGLCADQYLINNDLS